jgi:hypothetical protein
VGVNGLKNDNEGNFKIVFYAENRKNENFYINKFWLGHALRFLQILQSLHTFSFKIPNLSSNALIIDH